MANHSPDVIQPGKHGCPGRPMNASSSSATEHEPSRPGVQRQRGLLHRSPASPSPLQGQEECGFNHHVNTGKRSNCPCGNVFASAPVDDRLVLRFTADQKHGLPGAAQPRCAQRHALRWRFGCIEHCQGVRRARRGPPFVTGEQASGVAVLAQPEQHQIKIADRAQDVGVRLSRLNGPQFPRNLVQLCCGNGNVVEPGISGHARVARWVVLGQTSLVAKVDVPRGPVGARLAQPSIRPKRRVSARENEAELPMRSNGTISRCQNTRRGGRVQRLPIGQQVPAALLFFREFHQAC